MDGVDKTELLKAIELIKLASIQKHFIYVGGNGGSAAISNHLVCDLAKGCRADNFNSIKVVSLSSNVPVLTAIANDIGYKDTLSYQLQGYLENKQGLVILISSSGNSPNILEACKMSQFLGAQVIGMTGFDGGDLKLQADVNLHVPIHNYGVVEDCHQSLMHLMAQYIAKQRKDINECK